MDRESRSRFGIHFVCTMLFGALGFALGNITGSLVGMLVVPVAAIVIGNVVALFFFRP